VLFFCLKVCLFAYECVRGEGGEVGCVCIYVGLARSVNIHCI
jgi:hypothetical protein